jgi:ABC-type oligopeptide transport system substrate-binding subunit
MKKLLFVLVTAVALLTTSCSKQTTLEKRLDGETWKATKYDVTMGGITVSALETGETAFFTFDEGGKGTYTSSTGDADFFTWTVSEDGKTVTILMEDDDADDAMVFTVSEDSTSKKQIWSSTIPDGGVSYTISVVLEKQ